MFGTHKIKLEGDLLDKVKKCSEACGYASVDEFVLHALEKEPSRRYQQASQVKTAVETIVASRVTGT